MRVLLLIYFLISLSAKAETIDRVIATVNDDIVTQSDVTNFKKKLQKNGLVDEALLAMYDKKTLLADNKALVEYLIEEKIIESDVRKQGLITPIEQVESEIRNIAKQRGLDRNQLKALLKREGVEFSEYQDFIKTSLQRQNLLQKEVTSKIKISDDEVNSYYVAKYSNQNALIFEYTLAHILFLNSNGGPAGAEKRANEVYAKIQQGLPFETLAAQYSEDPQFVQGGLFGTFRASDFNKDVAKSITQLNVSDISKVIVMPDGYRIFKVLKKSLVPSPDLESKREDIRRLILSENFKKQFRVWLDQKRREAFIKIN